MAQIAMEAAVCRSSPVIAAVIVVSFELPRNHHVDRSRCTDVSSGRNQLLCGVNPRVF